MSKNKTKISLSILSTFFTLSLITGGCSGLQEQNAPGDQETKVSKRFQQENNKKTAVESAVSLSEKHARLSEKHSELKEKYESKVEENQKLLEERNKLRARLKQTEKELKEANTLLKETVSELNEWKSNVLGFQQEVHEADEAQLRALYKILKLMSGEPPQPNNIADPNQVENQNNTSD